MRLRLKEFRIKQALTQQELADKAETTKANISRIEQGLQEPRPGTIRKLADALGVLPEELIVWGAEPEETETGKAAA